MAEPSSNKSLFIALIGAFATIGAALIGVATSGHGSKADSPSLPEASRRPEVVEVRVTGNVRAEPPPPTPTLQTPQRLTVAPSERAPISVSYRKAAVPGQGMVLGLTNATERQTLKNVVVLVRSSADAGERSYKVTRSMKPRETISVGWRELDGWKLQPGDRVKIKADGQSLIEVVVPRL